MTIKHRYVPPVGVPLSKDTLNRSGRVRARIRWTDSTSHVRRSYSITVNSLGEANSFFEQMESKGRTAIDPLIPLTDYIEGIGNQFLLGLDPTSTASSYRGGIKLRVIPELGHRPVRNITTGVIDRTIDVWELTCSSSTLKNTIAALTKVLDEAVRDEIITTNHHESHSNPRQAPFSADRGSVSTKDSDAGDGRRIGRCLPVGLRGVWRLRAALRLARCAQLRSRGSPRRRHRLGPGASHDRPTALPRSGRTPREVDQGPAITRSADLKAAGARPETARFVVPRTGIDSREISDIRA